MFVILKGMSLYTGVGLVAGSDPAPVVALVEALPLVALCIAAPLVVLGEKLIFLCSSVNDSGRWRKEERWEEEKGKFMD